MGIRRSAATAAALLLAGLGMVRPPDVAAANTLVTASPKVLAFAANRADSQIVFFSNQSKNPLGVRVECTPPFQTEADHATLQPGENFTVPVTLGNHDPSRPLEPGKLRVFNLAGIQEASVKLTYTPGGSTLPWLSYLPSMLDFGTVAAGQSNDLILRIVGNQRAEATVAADVRPPLLLNQDAHYDASLGEGAERVGIIRVSYAPRSPQDNLNSTIDFMADGKLLARVPVRGKAGPPLPTILTFDKPELDFGNVVIPLDKHSAQGQQQFRLTVSANNVVRLTFTTPVTPFSLIGNRPDGFELGPGSELTLGVGYQISGNYDLGEIQQVLLIHAKLYKPEPVHGKLVPAGEQDVRLKLRVVGVAPPVSEAVAVLGDEVSPKTCQLDPPPPPPWLWFCSVAPTRFESHSITIFNRHHGLQYRVSWEQLKGPPFNIQAPPAGGVLLAPLGAPSGNTYTLPVTFTADESHETGSVTIRGGAPDRNGSTTLVNLATATLLGNVNSVSIAPSIIDFGTVVQNQNGTPRKCMVYNHGPQNRVVYWENTGPFWADDENLDHPYNVAAGGYVEMTIRFTAEASVGIYESPFYILDQPVNAPYPPTILAGAIVHANVIAEPAPQLRRFRGLRR